MPAPVPAELMGLWRRELLTAPGFRDDTTRVTWLQALHWYVDMRVPADRLNAGAGGFSDCDDAMLLDLARTRGGAGLFAAADGLCAWSRDMGHQPPGPLPDEARYRVERDVMIEDGIHDDYQETWRREPDSQGPFAAFQLVDAGDRRGLLLIAGRHMMDFVSRPGPMLRGDPLPAQVERALAAGDRPFAETLLDSRMRHATHDSQDWRVTLASLPWLEGRPMWPGDGVRLDIAAGRLETGVGADRAAWALLGASQPLEALDDIIIGGAGGQ
jgi:hypothetical protein